MNAPSIIAATAEAIARGADLLRQGRLVAFPTETVYGLGGDATSDQAVAAVFAAKQRPRFNPLIVHGATLDQLRALVDFNDQADRVAQAFWPGPLTLILPRRPACSVSLLASAGLNTLAVRMPDHAVAQDLIRAFGHPLVGPSANPSGRISPTRAAHVAAALNADTVALVLDGGPCRVGLESTVLDLTEAQPAILRPGGITAVAIEAVIGSVAGAQPIEDTAPRKSPGMLASHYAPALPVRLQANSADADEALLAFGPHIPSDAAITLNLSRTGDVVEAAANLFAMLRALDHPNFARIAVMPIPEIGLGVAINDRLRRAAAPRS
ncbi:MAG: threonylcarbamoyl-AMP synthase [Alphaproteobacteria bacterium]|nr:threonylcarbamoyl-AMP synthase [Alphaproteobacteria bacterium]